MENQTAQDDMKRLVALIDEQPDNWQAYVDLVVVLTVTENLAEAEELALKSLGLFERDETAKQALFYALGNVYYAAGEYGQATATFNQVTDEQLVHDATVMQAQSWYAQNAYQRALAFALTSVEQQPFDVAAQVLLGKIWLALQDLQQARQAFEAALHVDATDFEANLGRGIVETVMGEPDNPWLLKAAEADSDRYRAEAGRLDEIVQLSAGSRQDG
jgi:tetratricopeptide (TPR) repeat protein